MIARGLVHKFSLILKKAIWVLILALCTEGFVLERAWGGHECFERFFLHRKRVLTSQHRQAVRLPSLVGRKKLRVLYVQGFDHILPISAETNDLTARLARGGEDYMRRGRPLRTSGAMQDTQISVRILRAHQIRSKSELVDAINAAAAEADVVFIRAHGSPYRVRIGENVYLEGPDFLDIDLKGKIVALEGCGTGSPVHAACSGDVARGVIGDSIPREDRLIDGIIANSGADAVVAPTLNALRNRDGLFRMLVLNGGGQAVPLTPPDYFHISVPVSNSFRHADPGSANYSEIPFLRDPDSNYYRVLEQPPR